IYRLIETRQIENGDKYYAASIPQDLPAAAREKIPGLQTVAAYHFYRAKISIPGSQNPTRKFDNKQEYSSTPTTILADPEYFTIFKYDWLAGNPTTALKDPFTVVLSEAKAHKYFGSIPLDQLMGREMVFNDSLRVRVAGIVKDWKGITDFPFSEFISSCTLTNSFLKKGILDEKWDNGTSPWGSRAWVKLVPGTDPARIRTQLAQMSQGYKTNPDIKYGLSLQPLTDIHFNNDIEDGIRKAHLPTLYVLMGIALFILALAAINFINLSTALSIRRAKEIGVRKVMGGNRRSIAFQFLTETFLLSLFALLLAVLSVKPLLSAFHDFVPAGVDFHPLDPATFGFVLLLTLITTLLAGFYPAKVLSAYLPVLSLKGAAVQAGPGKWYLRKSLIVFQFTISLIFIISAIVISRQINYMRSHDLGFTTDAIISVETNPEDSVKKVELLAEKIQQLSGVQQISRQSFTPMSGFRTSMPLQYKGKREQPISSAVQLADENFIPLYQIKLLAGRNLRPDVKRDSIKEFVVNESFTTTLGLKKPEEAIGQFVYLGDKPIPIVGVVADFHENSYHVPIRPVVIFDLSQPENSLAIKLASKGKEMKNIKTTLSQMEKIWKEIYPGKPFDWSFLDESIAGMYKEEQKTANLMKVATAITIFISCMGLFGLSMFTAGQRTKEIGIRKVLGASVASIISLLSRDFVLLIGLSLVVSSPVAWYCMHRWLESFAYRAPIPGWIFVLAGGIALLVGLITMSFQAVRAARTNPVKALRAE
ncbi:MAG TPA: FtsX-like permease family protein, partial [Puia sp.]|nr:FtsX-like permease family protein [Puia sp.]